jgi:dihydrofolate reductase
MRKVISFMHVSLDGFVTGPRNEMNWIIMDDEIFRDATNLRETDTALYGRVTYQMMEGYWPTVLANAASTKLELQHAEWVEKVNKIVFSTTLEKAEWNNTRLMRKNIVEQVNKLKQEPGKNMMIFGSPTLTHSFMHWNLIDEYKLNINPVILGTGTPLFENILQRINLNLLSEKKYKSGVIGLRYETKLKNATSC